MLMLQRECLTNLRLLLRRESRCVTLSLVSKNTQAPTYERIVDCRTFRFSWAENERQNSDTVNLLTARTGEAHVESRGRLCASAIHEQYTFANQQRRDLA